MLIRLLAVLVLCLPAFAQPGDDVDAEKNSPVRKQLEWVLKSINNRAAPDAGTNFTPRFLEQFKVEDVQKRLSTLRDEAFKGAEVSLVRHEAEPRPDAMSCIIGNEDEERYLSLILSVDEKTGKIAGMLFAITAGAHQGGGAAWDDLNGDLGRVQGGLWFGAYAVNIAHQGTAEAEARVDPVYEFGWRKWLNLSHVSRAWVFGAAAKRVADAKCKPGDALPLAGNAAATLRDAIAASAKGDADATDALLKFLGRDEVEEYVKGVSERPERTMPYLSQRENSLLKAPVNNAILEKYAKGDEDDRRNILAPSGELPKATASTEDLAAWKQPREIQRVGWFASNREAGYALANLHALCTQQGMGDLAEAWRAPNPTLGGKPAMEFDPAVWKKTWFLGGSEPGVMSLAWLLERDDGKMYVMVMAWNNVEAPLEEPRLYEMAKKGLEVLSKEGRK
ncbi:MAG: hypothetical protein JSR77_10895 [Planctomycetes bacterium]|nr:hypothetical protein [Planctomycetota bacterium]